MQNGNPLNNMARAHCNAQQSPPDRLSTLPPEVQLLICSNLPAVDIARMRCINRNFNNFIQLQQCILAKAICNREIKRLQLTLNYLDFTGLDLFTALLRWDRLLLVYDMCLLQRSTFLEYLCNRFLQHNQLQHCMNDQGHHLQVAPGLPVLCNDLVEQLVQLQKDQEKVGRGSATRPDNTIALVKSQLPWSLTVVTTWTKVDGESGTTFTDMAKVRQRVLHEKPFGKGPGSHQPQRHQGLVERLPYRLRNVLNMPTEWNQWQDWRVGFVNHDPRAVTALETQSMALVGSSSLPASRRAQGANPQDSLRTPMVGRLEDSEILHAADDAKEVLNDTSLLTAAVLEATDLAVRSPEWIDPRSWRLCQIGEDDLAQHEAHQQTQ